MVHRLGNSQPLRRLRRLRRLRPYHSSNCLLYFHGFFLLGLTISKSPALQIKQHQQQRVWIVLERDKWIMLRNIISIIRWSFLIRAVILLIMNAYIAINSKTLTWKWFIHPNPIMNDQHHFHKFSLLKIRHYQLNFFFNSINNCIRSPNYKLLFICIKYNPI